MDATVRARHMRECLASQRHAATAHELAASALEVVFSASEDGKQPWISTACAAQEAEAIEGRSARERLFALIDAGYSFAEVEECETSRNEPKKDEPRNDTWLRAIARIALNTVRRGVVARRA
jgi:hypothetical protein